MQAITTTPRSVILALQVILMLAAVNADLTKVIADLFPDCLHLKVNCKSENDGSKALKCISCGINKFIKEEEKCAADIYPDKKKPVEAAAFLGKVKENLSGEWKDKADARAKAICTESTATGNQIAHGLAKYFESDFNCARYPEKEKDHGRVLTFKKCTNIYVSCNDNNLLCVTCNVNAGGAKKSCEFTPVEKWKLSIPGAEYIASMQKMSPLYDVEFQARADGLCKGESNGTKKTMLADHVKLFMLEACAEKSGS